MSSLPPRASTYFADVHSSLSIALSAAALGEEETALAVMRELQQRTAAMQRLPAHHQRRAVMRELGFLNLRRVAVPFTTLCSPTSDIIFVDDEVGVIPDSTQFAKLARLPPADFYEHTRLTPTESLILFQELRPLIIKP